VFFLKVVVQRVLGVIINGDPGVSDCGGYLANGDAL
jgi:hypothetical protein